MQFQVPQFIEIEDKIIGPLTIKQFLYIAAMAGLSFILFFMVNFWFWIIMATILMIIGAAFAFVNINGQPLIKIVFSALQFYMRPRLYLWQRESVVKELLLPETGEFGAEGVIAKRETLKNFFSEMPDIKNLWRELLTTKNPLPQREKSILPTFKSPAERFELFRKLAGQKEVARRVDFR